MQKISVDEVASGAIIAKDIFNIDGVMLIPKGAVLRGDFVQRLEEIGVNEVFIEDEEAEKQETIELFRKSVDLDDVIYEKTRFQAQKQIKKIIVKLSTMSNINLDKICTVVEEIIEQMLSKKDIVLTLSRLRSIDDYTYEHSVNVSVLSLMVGIDMNLDKETLKKLGIGAILHDIGKIGISEDILKKPTRLTNAEYDEIRRHTDFGYEILMGTNVSEEAAQIALHHHEKFDGSGYNAKLKGKNIPMFSRIVAVADVYDAMSNDRIYKKRMPPDRVYKEIARLANSHFDSEIMERFVKHLSLYPVGTGVILNTNHKGIVVAQNKLLPESPVIRVFKKVTTDMKVNFTDIDLSTTKYLYVKETF